MKGAHVKFSLFERDGDSNRFLPSYGIIPNTNPYFPHWGRIGSPLVQLRNQLHGSDQRRTLKDKTNMPRGLGTLTRPWAYAIGSPHILTVSRVRTLTTRVSGLS